MTTTTQMVMYKDFQDQSISWPCENRLGEETPCEGQSVQVLVLLAYDAQTDEDEPPMAKKFHPLADLFQGKHFYVFENDFDLPTLHSIRRIIYAYDGVLDKQINPNVDYVVSNRSWNDDFEKVTSHCQNSASSLLCS